MFNLVNQGPAGLLVAATVSLLLNISALAVSSLAASPSPAAKVLGNERYRGGEDTAGLCDVYLPLDAAPEGGFPAVLVIHGGGWVAGDKWTMFSYCNHLATAGYVAVSINYRHAPEFKFPAQADDVRDALVWIKEQHQRLNINTQRMGVFGYSAGGHLAALIGLLGDAPGQQYVGASDWQPDDPRWRQLPKLKAICAGGPPCDFRPLPPDNIGLAFFLGGSQRQLPQVYRAASPAEHISPHDPPVLLIHGEQDNIVPLAGTQAMHEALLKQGLDSRLEVIAEQGHMLTFINPQTSTAMLSFFGEFLGDARAR